MSNDQLQRFEDQPIRTVWDEETEEWYFSVVDVVSVLTDQATTRNASTYWAVLKKRLKEEGADQLLTNCKQLKLKTHKDGKRYLTDEWQTHGVEQGREYALLTDEITRAWSGMSTRQYKRLKGLKKENLRDNMSTLELALNMLAGATTTELTKTRNPQGLAENQDVARRGGRVAGDARKAIEKESGRPVIISENAAQLNTVVATMIEDVAESTSEDNKNK